MINFSRIKMVLRTQSSSMPFLFHLNPILFLIIQYLEGKSISFFKNSFIIILYNMTSVSILTFLVHGEGCFFKNRWRMKSVESGHA